VQSEEQKELVDVHVAVAVDVRRSKGLREAVGPRAARAHRRRIGTGTARGRGTVLGLCVRGGSYCGTARYLVLDSSWMSLALPLPNHTTLLPKAHFFTTRAGPHM
jgi:hypothetical protein